MLRQTGTGQWDTTVLLTDVAPACYDLATAVTAARSYTPLVLLSWQGGSRPAKVIWDLVAQTASGTLTLADRAASVIQLGGGQALPISATASFTATASSCEVTLTFAGLPQVPETASLVLDDGAASFDIPLVVSRDVTLVDYLAIPVLVGAILAVLFVLLIGLFVPVYWPKGPPVRFTRRSFWVYPVTASGVWSLRDSWATNITSALAVLGITVASSTAAGSLFPGVPLDRFAIVCMTAVAIVLSAPAVLGILRALQRVLPEFGVAPPAPVAASPAGAAAAGPAPVAASSAAAAPHAAPAIVGETGDFTANFGSVLIAATVTMFGIGAEIGVATVLAYDLSEADFGWRVAMLIVITLAGLLLLLYSVTAIRALVLRQTIIHLVRDIQPGSALVNASETSFIL